MALNENPLMKLIRVVANATIDYAEVEVEKKAIAKKNAAIKKKVAKKVCKKLSKPKSKRS